MKEILHPDKFPSVKEQLDRIRPNTVEIIPEEELEELTQKSIRKTVR
jgi:hypothetical protein